jgi:hypothetical protein
MKRAIGKWQVAWGSSGDTRPGRLQPAMPPARDQTSARAAVPVSKKGRSRDRRRILEDQRMSATRADWPDFDGDTTCRWLRGRFRMPSSYGPLSHGFQPRPGSQQTLDEVGQYSA